MPAKSGTYVLAPNKRSAAQKKQVKRETPKAAPTPQKFASQKPAPAPAKKRPTRVKVAPVLKNAAPIYKPTNYSPTPRLHYFPKVRNLHDAGRIMYHQAKAMGVDPNDMTGGEAQARLAKALRSPDANQRGAARQLDRIIKAVDKYNKTAPAVERGQQAHAGGNAEGPLGLKKYARRKGLMADGSPFRAPGGALKIADKAFVDLPSKATKFVYTHLPEEIPIEAGTATGLKIGAGGGAVPTAHVRTNSKVVGNAAKDALTLPMTTVTSTYLLGKAAADAGRGKTGPIKKQFKDFKNNDPIALLAQGKAGKAIKAAGEHPVSTALELSAVKAGIGRSAGAIARRGTKSMRRAGSTQRAPEVLYGDHVKHRTYSPDIISKAAQVAVDKIHEKGGGRPTLKGSEQKRVHAEVEKILHEQVAVGEHMRRQNRNEIIHKFMPSEVKKSIRGLARNLSKTDRQITTLVIDGTLRTPETAHEDLMHYHEQLAKAQEELAAAPDASAVKIKANADMLNHVENAITHGMDSDLLFRVADEYKAGAKVAEKRAEDGGFLEPARAAKAREVPYAVTHMGAREVDLTPQFVEHRKALTDVAHKARVLEDRAYRKWVGDRKGRAPGDPAREKAKVAYEDAKSLRVEAEQTIRLHAKEGKKGPHLVDPEGNVLNAEAIRAHREAAGVGEPGFASQRIEQNMKNAALVNKMPKRGHISTERRTGEGSYAGTYDPSYTAAYTHLIRLTGLADWASQFDRLLGTFGVKMAGASKAREFRTAKQAKRWMESVEGQKIMDEQNLPELVPVRVSPIGAKNSTIRTILNSIEDSSDKTATTNAGESLVAETMREANENDHGPVVLVPKHIWDLAQKHYAPSGVARKGFQSVNSQFKSVVLPLSTKWIAGNIIDNVIRLAVAGAGPRDIILARNLLKAAREGDEKAGRELAARLVNGMQYSARGRMGQHRTADDFSNEWAHKFHLLGKTESAKAAAAPWRTYRDVVFDANAKLEHVFELAAVGRVARQEIRSGADRWEAGLRVQPRAVEDLANGLRNTPAQIKFAREVRQIVGNWTTYSPGARAFLFDYLPFGTWMKNALQFVFVTLPVKHPILTGVAAASSNMTREDRKRFGLEPGAKGAQLSFLQGGIPHKGGVIPTAGLTSFGFAGGFPGTIATMPLAPFRSADNALQGRDWKNDKLVNADGTPLSQPQAVAYGAYVFAETMIPLMAMARRIREQGGKQQGPSYVWKTSVKRGSKKGTGATVKKTFNPFAPTYSKHGSSGASIPSNIPDFSTSKSSSANIPDFSSSTPGSGNIPDFSGASK
jgi:hypothetical protein